MAEGGGSFAARHPLAVVGRENMSGELVDGLLVARFAVDAQGALAEADLVRLGFAKGHKRASAAATREG